MATVLPLTWNGCSPPQPSSTSPPLPFGRKAKSRAMSQPPQYALIASVIGAPYECRPPYPSSVAPDCGELAPGRALAARAMFHPGHDAPAARGPLLSLWTPPHPSSVYRPLNGMDLVAVGETCVVATEDHALTPPAAEWARERN